jgi:hypothetical protein
VHKGLAASTSSRLFASHATIPPVDFTSFTTDHQQLWLPTPPSSVPATAPQTHNSFNQDFPLFGTAQGTPPCLPQHSRAQATSSTAPSQTLSHRPRRHLSLLVQHNSPSTNIRSYSNPTQHNQQYRQHQARQIPPIPLFSDRISQAPTQEKDIPSQPRRIQSTSGIPQGTSHHTSSPKSPLSAHASTDMSSSFDNLYLPGDDSFVSHDNVMDFGYSTSNFVAVNNSARTHSSDDVRTVSPQELTNNSIMMSTPSSTAFPPLSTPGSGYLESPFMESSSLDTSPMIDGALDSTLNYSDFTAPLFPQDGMDFFGQLQHEVDVNSSFASATGSSHISNASPLVRQKSSPGRPSTSGQGHARKHSSVAGVRPSKARKPLDPIIIGDADSKEDAKRKKNTAAARKSRQRRQENQEQLETEIQRLRNMVTELGGDPDE